jgi:type IV pilus assembly protein PilQ
VLIEARIVTLTSGFRKELGINWSGRFSAAPQYGNALGYRFPYTVDIPSFGVNLPTVAAPVGTTGPITFGSIDDVISIFARIDAAEEEYKAKNLGQPKIFTQDNLQASVSTGRTVTIPPAGDAEPTEVTASLSLDVTPRISSDGYVTMNVTVTNSSLDLSGENPTTNDQELTSLITVRDGETAVIGGVYQTLEIQQFQAVPFLHRIPILGHLFKSSLPNEQSQSELLVFLTPRILDRSLLKPEQEGVTEIY